MSATIRKLRALIILAGFCAACSNCATTQPVLTKVEHVVDCTAPKVVSQLPAIATDVTTDLLSKDYIKLLEDVGRRVLDDTLVCAVALAANGADARMSAHPGYASPNASVISTNAADYLRIRDVHFSTPMAAVGPLCSPACNACQVCTPFTPPTYRGICLPRVPKPAGCP